MHSFFIHNLYSVPTFLESGLYNNRLALVSIYGPNETDSAFLTQISKTLLEETDCPLVVGGDFNAVINPALDKSQSDTTACHAPGLFCCVFAPHVLPVT